MNTWSETWHWRCLDCGTSKTTIRTPAMVAAKEAPDLPDGWHDAPGDEVGVLCWGCQSHQLSLFGASA